jgi:hypothetical protein
MANGQAQEFESAPNSSVESIVADPIFFLARNLASFVFLNEQALAWGIAKRK